MHSRDRYWRVIAGIWLGLMLLFLAVLLGIFSSFDFSLSELIHKVDWLSLNTYAQITMCLALLVAIYRFGAQYAILARLRERCRRLALGGDSSAMPMASSQPEMPMETLADATLRLAHGATVSAMADGLLWRRPKQRDVKIAWDEARLLELWAARGVAPSSKDDLFRYGYCVYADTRKFIEWSDEPADQDDETQEALLGVIMAHARLPLRVVASGRSSEYQGRRHGFFRRVSLTGVALVLAIPLIPLATAILALVAPLTRSPALNLYTAVTLGAVGLRLLALPLAGIRATIWPPERPLNLPLHLPPTPLLAYPQASIAIRAPSSRRQAPVPFLLTILVVGNSYPLVRAFIDDSHDNPVHGGSISLAKLAVDGLMICLIIAIPLLLLFLFERSSTLLADEAGLHWGKGKHRKIICWPDVEQVAAHKTPPDTLEFFTATERRPRGAAISWSADARWVLQPDDISANNDGAGAQFAALVAARAGVQPVTRWE